MTSSDLLTTRLRRLIPHEGLVIDVATWASAHDYHAIHQRLHYMTMHSPGVVSGLEVVAWNPPDSSVVINPGVAIDPEGRMIIVSEPQRFQLQTHEAGTVYLVLQFREVPGESAAPSGADESRPRYVLEVYRLEERRDLPREPYVELARVQVSGSGAPVSDAEDVFNPGPDEIDLRYRMASGPRPVAEVRIGIVPLEMTPGGQIVHAQGTMSLVRAINNTTRLHARFKGSVNLNQEVSGCDLIVLAGQGEFNLAGEWTIVLRRFMEGGGVLLGEACGANAGGNGNLPFRQSFIQLAERLGRELVRVERGHPLFRCHHVFAEAPEGADGPPLVVAADGIVYSDGDYGCLWDGGRPDRPTTREQIRSATEFGVNIGVFSSERVRMHGARLVAR